MKNLFFGPTKELIDKIDLLLDRDRNSFSITDRSLLKEIKGLLLKRERLKSSEKKDDIKFMLDIILKLIAFFC